MLEELLLKEVTCSQRCTGAICKIVDVSRKIVVFTSMPSENLNVAIVAKSGPGHNRCRSSKRSDSVCKRLVFACCLPEY